MVKILVKVHESYRKIISVCDPEVLGKKFEEGRLQLDVNPNFYGGKELDFDQAVRFLRNAIQDDASFNFVGKNSIDAGSAVGIIDKKHVLLIQGIPHALGLL
jgi:hypothetical protein